MPFQDDDKEFFRQLAWLYPFEYVKEIKAVAAQVLKEQFQAGERQNIREIVYSAMERINKSKRSPEEKQQETEKNKQEIFQAEENKTFSERTASLLASGQGGLLAGFGPPVIAHLAAALNDECPAIVKIAYETLLNFDVGYTIDALCRLWADTRRLDLENIIVRKGYLAAKPLRLRVLTVLKTEADSYMLAINKETLTAVFKAIDDNDRQISARAKKMLLSLEKKEDIDTFCQMVLENLDDKKMLSLAVDAQHIPSIPARAALFYCLSGQWEKYYTLENQQKHPLLCEGYAQAAPGEKEAFLALAVGAGHSRLAVEILASSANGQEFLKINETSWRAIIKDIALQQDLEFLAGLILQTPPEVSREIMLILQQAGWQAPKEQSWNKLSLCLSEAETNGLFIPDGRETAVLVLDEPGGRAECLAFHPNELLLASGGVDGVVRFWRLGDKRPYWTVVLANETISAMAFSEDGRFLVVASKAGKVNIWGMPSLTWAGAVKGQTGQVLSIAINNTGHIWAAVKDNLRLPVIRLWYWDGVSMTNKALLPQNMFNLPAVHPGLRQALGVNSSGQLRIWPTKTGQVFAHTQAHQAKPLALAITPCGSLAAVLDETGCLNICAAATGALLGTIAVRKTCQGCLAFSTKGDLAAVVFPETNTITVYQTRWVKPLAAATEDDFTYVTEMMKLQDKMKINSYKYIAALLSAKFHKEG